jgi:hypothetical protein
MNLHEEIDHLGMRQIETLVSQQNEHPLQLRTLIDKIDSQRED